MTDTKTKHYNFELISFDITNTRSRHEDTDYTSFHLAIKDKDGKIRTYKKTKFNGNLNNGNYPIGLSFDDIAVEPDDHVVMNYLIVNNGHEKGDNVTAELEKAGDELATTGAQAAGTAAGAAIGSAIPIPGIGTAIGAVAGWLATKLGGLLFANCDGPVAAEQVTLSAKELADRVEQFHGLYEAKTHHSGTNSPAGCGSNSQYDVTWAIRRRD
jgi:hypothetical protein